MNANDIVSYWSQLRQNSQGEWIHPDDEALFAHKPHSFNLDHPVSPYIGDILNATIVVLGANAGYRNETTPYEFPNREAINKYLARIRDPAGSDWRAVSKYYDNVNYSQLIISGKLALINACPYRSPKISAEPENRRLIKSLPSARFIHSWLLEALLPKANAGKRLIVANRYGLWNLPSGFMKAKGVVIDPAPVSKHLTGIAWQIVQERAHESPNLIRQNHADDNLSTKSDLDRMKILWENLRIGRKFSSIHHFSSHKFATKPPGLKGFHNWCKYREILDENLQTIRRALRTSALIQEGQDFEDAAATAWKEVPVCKR